MNDTDLWLKAIQLVLDLSSTRTEEIDKSVRKSGGATTTTLFDDPQEIALNNPLYRVPFEIRMELISSFFNPDETSKTLEYLKDVAHSRGEIFLESFLSDLYKYAVRIKSHVLCNNAVVLLSQLPYKMLGSWADMLALAATRNPSYDIQEFGIRCFENWEDKSAVDFLHNCKFNEKWLQEYADEVYSNVMKEGSNDILSEKNYSWTMAGRKTDLGDNAEGYRS